MFNVRLTAGPNNAGQVGEASFAAQGNATNIVLTLSGVSSRVTRPVHLYTYPRRDVRQPESEAGVLAQ
jgi:hypothetical protein